MLTRGLACINDDLHTLPTLTGVVVPPELELPTSREKKNDYYSELIN